MSGVFQHDRRRSAPGEAESLRVVGEAGQGRIPVQAHDAGRDVRQRRRVRQGTGDSTQPLIVFDSAKLRASLSHDIYVHYLFSNVKHLHASIIVMVSTLLLSNRRSRVSCIAT